MPPQGGARVTSLCIRRGSRQELEQPGAVGPVQPGPGLVRRSTAISWRRTSSSMCLDAVDRAEQDQSAKSRMKIR
jgi:hypothetical protein